MSQFGADTTIDHDVKLVILDCFDTLVELIDGVAGYRPRKGVEAFLRHYGVRLDLPLVVVSDADERHLEAVLVEAGLATSFVALYGAPRSLEDLGDGRQLKRLDLPLADHGVIARKAVFIGDSPFDAQAAQRHGLRFIRVPGSADRDFSFERLIAGPSRYRSAEYTTRMLRRFKNEGDVDGAGDEGGRE